MADSETQSHQREWGQLIDGEFTDGDSTHPTSVYNPATGEEIAQVPTGTVTDINEAVSAARDAYDEWRWLDQSERQSILYDIADRIGEHAEELTELETLENGKPLEQAANDVRNAEERFRFFAGGIDKFYSDLVKNDQSQLRMKSFEPYGVVGVIIPWNWPPMHTGDFVSVALATGNTVVLKPSPDTPLSSLRMAELMADLLPDGVLNVVTGGVEPGAALAGHEDIDKLAFTGSDTNGEKVLASAAENITSTMLELGGKNPVIVLPDAPLEEAITTTVVNAFYNSGQACSNPERLLVHESIYEEFVSGVAEQVECPPSRRWDGSGHPDRTTGQRGAGREIRNISRGGRL